MKPEDAQAMLSRAVKRAWPNVSKASELPFPDYWKSVQEWLAFHAPHVGDKLMSQFVAAAVREAVLAEASGTTPKTRVVPKEVREIWARLAKETNRSKTHREEDGVRRAEPASQDRVRGTEAASQDNEAWEHAAERAAAVNDRFAGRRRVYGR